MPHKAVLIKGKRYPSITEVLGCLNKDWKEFWWRKVGFAEADRVSRESAELGTYLHSLVEKHLIGEAVTPRDNRTKKLFELWLDWFTESSYIFVSQEQFITSEKLKTGGTYDCLVRDKEGNLLLIDWKFSKNTEVLRPVQLAGYSLCFNEKNSEKIKNGQIVRIDPKEEKVYPSQIYELKKFEKSFKILRKAYDIWKGKI